MALTDLRTSDQLRRLSKRVFNSEFRIEVALAVAELEETFIFDELWEAVSELAARSEIEPPSASKVREEVKRMRVDFGALERLPRVRGSLIQREVRRPSALWALCRQLHDRAERR